MAKRKRTADVVIVGGGVIGCGAAWELAQRGARVVVLERSVPGAEASSAAAGILGAQTESEQPGAAFELALRSRKLHAKWAASLAKATGVDVEFRVSGVLSVRFDERAARELARERAFQKRRGCRVEALDAKRVRLDHTMLSERVAGGVAFPDDARLDPPKLLRALRIAAELAGAEFRSGTYARKIASAGGRARGVELEDGALIAASHVIVAAGSWSSLVGGVELPAGGVIPARGQIVELLLPAPLFREVVFGPDCYLVPRDDGRLLIGSTLEFVGYRREVTAVAVRDLLDAALTLVPGLAEATLGRAWSSFRPYVADGLPVLGETETRGLIVATGHHRNGILLAPATAEIVCALVQGRRPTLDITAFSPLRSGESRR